MASNFYYVSLFAASLVIMKCCFAVDWKDILFVGTAGYAVQHITYAIICVITGAARLGGVTLPVLDFLYDYFRHIPIYAATGALCYPMRQRHRFNSSCTTLMIVDAARYFCSIRFEGDYLHYADLVLHFIVTMILVSISLYGIMTLEVDDDGKA